MTVLWWLIRAKQGRHVVIRGLGQQQKWMSPGVPGGEGMGSEQFDRRTRSIFLE